MLENIKKEPQSSNSDQELLHELIVFSWDMFAEFKRLTYATNDEISANFKNLIGEKLEEFRKIARRSGYDHMVDKAQQTEFQNDAECVENFGNLSNLSAINTSDVFPLDASTQTILNEEVQQRDQELNNKYKQILLAESDVSLSVCSSECSYNYEQHKENTSEESINPENFDLANFCECQISEDELSVSLSEMDNAEQLNKYLSQLNMFDFDPVYDDGVNLAKYLRRCDYFSVVPLKSLSSLLSQETRSSDMKANDSFVSLANAINENDTKMANRQEQECDIPEPTDNDKEIERLVNLQSLFQSHENVMVSTAKHSSVKNNNLLKKEPEESNDNLNCSLADYTKDMSEIDSNQILDPITAEEQFLQRYNEYIMKELLEDSEPEDNLEQNRLSGCSSPILHEPITNVKKENDENNIDEKISEEVQFNSVKSPIKTDDHTNWRFSTIKKKKFAIDEKLLSTCTTDDDSEFEMPLSNSKRKHNVIYDSDEIEEPKKRQKRSVDLVSSSSEELDESEPKVVRKPRERKILRPSQLQRETLKAQKRENERVKRLEKHRAKLSKILSERLETANDDELILDYIEACDKFVTVDPELVKMLKTHQKDGVKFMYSSVYGDVESVNKYGGSGCILAHCMGLGKTLQLITLMHTVISYDELKTRKILVLCPKSTVMNWCDEINNWLEPVENNNLKVYLFSDNADMNEKIRVLRKWSKSKRPGCLLMGYETFRTLVFFQENKARKNESSKVVEAIGNNIYRYLLDPGADLVVCDEGHIIKNSASAISRAVAEIKTLKRIVLTGTPMQNNLKEYYSMVNFVKPLFLGTEREFGNLYANPIKDGQHKDSSKKEIKVMKQRSFVLHKKLSRFVQRKEPELLKTFLPNKFEYVLFIPMTDVQNKLYEHVLESLKNRSCGRDRNLIVDYTCLRKIWTHPKVLEDAWKNTNKSKVKHSNDEEFLPNTSSGVISVKNDWWRHLLTNNDLESILTSKKMQTLFEILKMCEENGEKCLIFSAFVAVLNMVEYFFQKVTNGDKEILNELGLSSTERSLWVANKDYYRLDGQTSKSQRHKMVYNFNKAENTRVRVFLISARAGGQGINLIGANRVIILDTSWNPANDQQNIFRVFRLGQQKSCYIYRLLAMGTMEEKVYSRSVTKQAMSYRVVDEQQIDRHYSLAELAELYILTKPDLSERPTPILPQDNILANILRNFPNLVYKYHEHDSLLENKEEQDLSEQEKNDAWELYERELQAKTLTLQQQNSEDLLNDSLLNQSIQEQSKQNPNNNIQQSTDKSKSLGAQHGDPIKFFDILNEQAEANQKNTAAEANGTQVAVQTAKTDEKLAVSDNNKKKVERSGDLLKIFDLLNKKAEANQQNTEENKNDTQTAEQPTKTDETLAVSANNMNEAQIEKAVP